jgi:hypothetical protein
MSFTTPPNLTQPDTSADIIRPRKLGTVNCINVARLGEPVTLRYFGASALCGATGQAHTTQQQAEADVLNWADGKPVAYEQQAVVPLGAVAPVGDAAKLAKLNADVLHNLQNGPVLVQNGVRWVSVKQAAKVLSQLTQAGVELLARVPRWVPVAEWEKVNHTTVHVLWVFHKGWNISEVYWDAMGQLWRRESTDNAFPHEVVFVTSAPALPKMPALPAEALAV